MFWFSLLMLAGEGAANTSGSVMRQTISQLSTPDELRGRVTSVNNIFTNGGPQLGQFRAGAVAEIWGPQFSAVTGGVLALALTVWVAVAVPAVRRYEIPSTTPPPEPAQSGVAPAAGSGSTTPGPPR